MMMRVEKNNDAVLTGDEFPQESVDMIGPQRQLAVLYCNLWMLTLHSTKAR